MSTSESSTAVLRASSEVLRDTAALLAAVERITPKILSVAGPNAYSIQVGRHADELGAIAEYIAKAQSATDVGVQQYGKTARTQALETHERIAESQASVVGSIQEEAARLLERAEAEARNAAAGDDRVLKVLEQELERNIQDLLLRGRKSR